VVIPRSRSCHSVLSQPGRARASAHPLVSYSCSDRARTFGTRPDAQIEYKGKGYFTGKSHTFKATLQQNSHTIQTYEGQWTGISHIGGSKGPVFLDTSAPKEEVTVAPVEQQGEWESRRLWERVAKGIRTGNYDEAGKEKARIEVGQVFLVVSVFAFLGRLVRA
jgi:hypothetical protein